jgi:hypothetical protein
MNRRQLSYAVLVVASLVISACSQPMGPARNDTTIVCDGIVMHGSGITCDDQ